MFYDASIIHTVTQKLYPPPILDSLDFLSAPEILDHIAPSPQPLSTSEDKLSVWVRSAQIHIIYSSKTNR